MPTVLQSYLYDLYEFYFTNPLEFVVLTVALYFLYRAIYTLKPGQFLRDSILALLIHHQLVHYMYVNEWVATILTLAILPFMQLLLEYSIEQLLSNDRREFLEPIIPRQFLK
jgi:hypothetical protein